MGPEVHCLIKMTEGVVIDEPQLPYLLVDQADIIDMNYLVITR